MRFLLLFGPVLGSLISVTQAEQPERSTKEPLLVAHRGLLRHAPENTLAAFAACMDLRLGLELDIRRSKDGQLVCVHDEDVKRTTNGTGKVAELSSAELRKLDAGAWFGPPFSGERIPTLDEVFGLLKKRKARRSLVALDLKIDDATVTEDIVRLAEKHEVVDQILCIGLSISDLAIRRKFRAASRKIAIAVLANSVDEVPQALADKDANWIYIRFLPSAEQITKMHSAGKRVLLVGPLVAGHEPENWMRARQLGVDALLTDFPLECRQTWRPVKTP